MDWQINSVIIILLLNVIGWVFAYGKFVGKVNGFLKRIHDPPCNQLKNIEEKMNDIQDKIDAKLDVLVEEIINIRERLVKIETKLEDKK